MTQPTTAVTAAFTKSQLLSVIAEDTGLSKVDVENVMKSLNLAIRRHIKAEGVGKFILPGLLRIKRVEKKAVPERTRTIPWSGKEVVVPAKPAHDTIRIAPVKALKDMVD